jgi:hypothetical protein
LTVNVVCRLTADGRLRADRRSRPGCRWRA